MHRQYLSSDASHVQNTARKRELNHERVEEAAAEQVALQSEKQVIARLEKDRLGTFAWKFVLFAHLMSES